MNMPMITTPLIAASGGSSPASGIAGKGAPTTLPGGKPGFASTLDQALGGDKGHTDSLNALTLTLVALLGGLIPGLQAMPSDQSGQSGLETANLQQAAHALQGNPVMLQKLLTSPGMEAWLKKAELLLQGLGETTTGAQTSDPAAALQPLTLAEGLPQSQALANQQAGNLVLQLLQAAGQDPQSPLMAQLVQDLSAMLGGGDSEPGQPDKASNRKQAPASNASPIDPANGLQSTSGVLSRSVKPVPMPMPAGIVQSAGDPAKPIASVAFSVKPVQANSSSLVKLAAMTQLQAPLLQQRNEASADVQPPAAVAPNPNDSGNLLPLMSPLVSAIPTDIGVPAALSQLPTSAGSFVQDMSQFVLKNFKLIESGSVSEAKLSLSPAHLGQVDVKITMQDGQIAAQFLAQTSTGKELIEGQLAQLRTALQNMGLQVDRIDVSQNAQLSSNLFQDGHHAQQSFQQQGRKQKEQSDRFTVPDLLALEPTTIGELRSLVQSSGFHATA